MQKYLLDKNIVRIWTVGLLKYYKGISLKNTEDKIISYVNYLVNLNPKLYIQNEVQNILLSKPPIYIRNIILSKCEPFFPTKYHKRWSRRIHKHTTITREDAKLITYATFGTNYERNILGVEYILTTDSSMYNEYYHQYDYLKKSHESMIKNLDPPFNNSKLPEIILIQI